MGVYSVSMEQHNATTDELVSEYTTERHKHAIADSNGNIDCVIEFGDNAYGIEDELESRGVSKDKLREFWSAYADEHGLDH